MALGQKEVARVRAGQGAKLLYDAFPYQRFGVKYGRVRWVGQATVTTAPARAAGADGMPRETDGVEFRALIDATDSTIVVRGEPRPLLAGMRGRARVVTGRRSLISYAFEPIRQLRENLSGTPPEITPPPARSAPPAAGPS
jgi:multidrug efflux pump subunit AcrA (membrane-fusion protein)